MKKILSIVLSFFILFNTISPIVLSQDFWEIESWAFVSGDNTHETNIDSILEPPNYPYNSWDLSPTDALVVWNTDQNWFFDSMITDGWQSWQVLEANSILGVNSWNIDLNWYNSYLQWQSWQNNEDVILNALNLRFWDIDLPQQRSLETDPELIISEVFFDWLNEWIEIYNVWSTAFSWNIMISWASASAKTINNLIILPQEIKIFADSNIDSIVDTWCVFQNNMWFNISDTQSISIQIIYSWEVVDSFNVSNIVVSSLPNKVSLHRFVDSLSISPVDLAYSTNTSSQFKANPWFVFEENVGSMPKLKITEIYFDWTENWLEISNIWFSDFSWNLNISWNLNFNISSNIPFWVSKVFTNSVYSMFQTGKNIQTIWDTINFNTGSINLDLIRSGQLLDNFYAHETQVEYYQEYWSSFEKIGSNASWITTVVWLNTDRYFNINRWIAANPTTYFTTGENLIDITKSRGPLVQDSDLPIDCDDFRENTSTYISEVYYWTWIYPSYVELNIVDDIADYYPEIKLSGSALSKELIFDTNDMLINTKVLLTSDDTWYNEWRNSVSNTWLSIATSWRIVVYWKVSESVRYILDIINVQWWKIWSSLYMWTDSVQCAGVFDYNELFSPGLNRGQSQFIQISPEPIVQYINIQWGSSCPQNNDNVFNSSDTSNLGIQISTLKHFANLQIIKLKNKTNEDIDLRDYQIQWLDWHIKSIKGNTLFAKQSMSFVWNYWFPTKGDYCVNLLKNNMVVDRYCRDSMSKANSIDEENILNQLEFWIDNTEDELLEEETELPIKEELNVSQTNTIKITNIDYDPPWADKDNESISLLLLTGGQLDLSEYIIQYQKDWKSINKKIKWILSYGNQQTFKWEYAFPNSSQDKKPIIVNLIQATTNHIIDTYTYNPNKITSIPNWEYQVLSVIDGDTIKILYADKEFNIRLAWADAPESSALRCGKVECFWLEAKNYLTNLLLNKTISFQSDSIDDFDRFVWYVFLNGENINQKLIKNWYAREYSYKNKSYQYQSEFKSAQIYAQNNYLWLWWNSCNGKRLCPVEETKIKDDYILNIENIVYDPEWNDSDKEEIKISMIKWFSLNFADWFYLMINDTKKSLKNYWTMSEWESKTLKWTFSFPNTKKTTVSLINWDTIFDTYIYDPDLDKLLEEKILSGEQFTWIYSGISISIISIIANPIWKDSLGEEIWLLYSWSEKSLDMSSWYYLKVWSTKKNLRWVLTSNQEALLTWNFWFPNKAGCVELGYKNFIFDKFCYPQAKEWQKFYISNWVLENISTINFDILKKSKLENIWNQVCLTYEWQKFYCKKMPYSKLSTKRLNQNKLYKKYFDVFENHLKNNWKIMYYNSDIKNYFNLLNEIEKTISNWMSTFSFDGQIYQTFEFKEIYENKYPSTTTVFMQKNLQDLIPGSIVSKYKKLKQEYEIYLMNNS